MSKGLEELGLQLSQLERIWARLGPCGAADGLKSVWPTLLPLPAPDELPALIRMAEGRSCARQGSYLGEDDVRLQMRMSSA